MPTDLPNNLVRTIPVIFERLMGGESAAEIAADYTREGAPLLPDDFAPIADAIARLRRLESRPVDPVAALRAVLAKNARIPHLEAEIAHLRKRDPSEELDAVQDALNEHPASPDIGDLSLAEQVRQIIKWWDETEVENNDAHNALDELGAPDKGTPAKRIRALAVAKDRQIAELEAIRAALAESPMPNAPADCDLAGWVRYLLRGWRSERKEASELAQLCQEAHNTLTSLGVPDEGTPAIRILYLAVAYRRQISELEEKVRALAAEREAQ